MEQQPATPALADNVDLLKGVLNDVQTLLKQEVQLMTAELKQDARTLGVAVAQIAVAALLGFLSLALFTFALAHLLAWYFVGLPLWGAFGIVSLILAVTATVVASSTRKSRSSQQWATGSI